MGVADGVPVGRAQRGKQLGELAATGCVDALEEPPVSAGREHQVLVVGQALWPPAADHPDGQVLVDHDHLGVFLRSGSVVGVATEDRVGHDIGVESGLELVGQVPGRDPGQDLPAFRGQTGVTRTPAPPALF